MIEPKLVKSTKGVKLPNSKGSVKATLRYALQQVDRQSWSKVFIVGEGIDGSYCHSRRRDITALGLIEKAKHKMLGD